MTTQNWAITRGDKVDNIIVWDGNEDVSANGWIIPEGVTMVPINDGTIVFSGTPVIGGGARIDADGSWLFEAPEPPPRAPVTSEQTIAMLTAMRDSFLTRAGQAIAPLQDKVELSLATEADTMVLKAWRLYRIALSDLDVSDASLTWPTPPNSAV